MPSKIKGKLLLITVFCITLAVLSVIAPTTAAIYGIVLLGLSMFLSILAWFNARSEVSLQYKVSDFITLGVLVFCATFCSVLHFAIGGMHYVIILLCVIIAFRSMSLLFSETK